MSHHTQRDFDQERSDRYEGHKNQMKFYEDSLNQSLASDEYSREEKLNMLQFYREQILQEEQAYSADMQRINEEEARYRAEQGYEEDFSPEAQAYAESYGYASDQSEYEVPANGMSDYAPVGCTYSAQEYTAENDVSQSM